MPDERSIVDRERCELIARRLPTFAFGWTGTLVIWLVVFALEGRLGWVAVDLVAAALLVLAITISLVRADPASPRVFPMALVTCVALGLVAIVLVEVVGGYAEVLAFLLLTLYVMAAQLFGWGWRAELTLLAATLMPWLVRFDALERFVPLPELAVAVTIGALLAVGVAEAAARNLRQVSRRRRAQREATEALQASRDAYRDLAENVPDLIWSADRTGRFTYVNAPLARFLGVSAEALLGRSIGEFFTRHPENPDFAASWVELLAGETLPPTAIECATPRGPRWVEVTSVVVRDPSGAVTGVRGISRDVHERRASQEALRTSEARYRGLVEGAHDAVTRFALDGRLTFANDAYCRAVGYACEDIVGRNPIFIVHPDDRTATLEAVRNVRRPPYRCRIESRGETTRGMRWYEWEMSAVRGDDGRIVEIQQIGRDVTVRHEADRALRESEERFRSAFEDAGVGMGVTSADGTALRVNPAFCAMFGLAEHELVGRTLYDLVHPEDRAALAADQQRLLSGAARMYRTERRYLRKDGTVMWTMATASLVRDAIGTPLYFIGQLEDITERHMAEEALHESIVEIRRSEEKLRLLAQRQVTIREEERKRVGLDLHDDVCQELVGVGIMVESLRRKVGPMPADLAADFERVVRYLGEVVEHLRLLARELRPLLLRDLGLDGSLRSLVEGMSSATLAVTADLQTPIPRLDEEVELTVYRIAQEALTNAVRHAGARAIVISLGVAADTLTLAVRDDGRGFDPAARPAVALGLASMEERALAVGGRLDVRSQPAAGTTVMLRCPLDARRAERVRELAGSSPTRSSSPPSTATIPRAVARD